MVDALLEEARKLVEEGTEARLAAAEGGVAAEAASEARELSELQGDANRAVQRRQSVAKIAGPDEA